MPDSKNEPTKNRIVVVIDEGMVSAVYATDPAGVEVVVVDHDTENTDDERLSTWAGAPAAVATEPVMPIDPASDDMKAAFGD